jgi:hypothetical protein
MLSSVDTLSNNIDMFSMISLSRIMISLSIDRLISNIVSLPINSHFLNEGSCLVKISPRVSVQLKKTRELNRYPLILLYFCIHSISEITI